MVLMLSHRMKQNFYEKAVTAYEKEEQISIHKVSKSNSLIILFNLWRFRNLGLANVYMGFWELIIIDYNLILMCCTVHFNELAICSLCLLRKYTLSFFFFDTPGSFALSPFQWNLLQQTV